MEYKHNYNNQNSSRAYCKKVCEDGDISRVYDSREDSGFGAGTRVRVRCLWHLFFPRKIGSHLNCRKALHSIFVLGCLPNRYLKCLYL
jgi:hypothetical protein